MIPAGTSLLRTSRCPGFTETILTGELAPEVPGVNLQGSAALTKRKWAFGLDNTTGAPVAASVVISCSRTFLISGNGR